PETLPVQQTPGAPAPRAPTAGPPTSFLLWVDGVAGYLVCLKERVTLGQATADNPADVPPFADISRLPAALTRHDGGYRVGPARPVQVNGKPAAGQVPLKPGDRVTLGESCQLVFHVPVPVSATARLESASGHRWPHSVEGVVLMAQNLVMGSGNQVHVSVPDL